MFDSWNAPTAERGALTAQCNRFTEWTIADGENISIGCSKTVRISGKTWAEFERNIKEKQKKFCDEKLNRAMYALIMPEFETLTLDGVLLDMTDPEGVWQRLTYDSVDERNYSEVRTKLSSIKSKISNWIRDHSVFEGCKAYDSLNILTVIRRDKFSDYVAAHRSRPVRVRDHNRGAGTFDSASPEADSAGGGSITR